MTYALFVCVLFGGAAGLYDPVRHIESARLYGNIDAYAYYFVDLLVGSPPQRTSVILDTGSALTAFPCTGCPHCGNHIDPAFNFPMSTTAAWVSCGAGCSGSCTTGHCSYHQSYQEGSAISGYWFTDNVRLGDAIQHNPPVHARLGCHQNENKLFYTQKANGIFGIQGARTLLQQLFDDRAHIESKIFAICLSEWGGRMTVGGHNASYHREKIQYVPLVGIRYGVPLVSMKVNGATITNFRTSVIDSGTTYTYMGSKPYRDLKSAIEMHCKASGKCGTRFSASCWRLIRTYADFVDFPTIDVHFGNGVVTKWEPRGYLYRKGQSDRFCLAFMDDGPNAVTVLGASWMLYHEVIFDLRSNQVGLVRSDCPQYRDRPRHDAALANMPVPAPGITMPQSLEPITTTKPTSGTVPAARAWPFGLRTAQTSTSMDATTAASTTVAASAASFPTALGSSAIDRPSAAPAVIVTHANFDEKKSVIPAQPERLQMKWQSSALGSFVMAIFLVFVAAALAAFCITCLVSKKTDTLRRKGLDRESSDSRLPPKVVGTIDEAGVDAEFDADDESNELVAKGNAGDSLGPLE
mmetsp:Transcript_87055/g.244137  ORF Transcript_87055/g.244137 Transcript_87055/m.244137 type:complete len:580 (-) Transcript_87055:97-1836(-)